jgi:DNA-binding PadR family transcriptional regulator
MPRESKTKYIILGLLTVRPKSGYDIKQDIIRSTSNFWRESYGQIYPTLAQLLHEGCVSCDIKQCGARKRKIYKITKKGMRILQKWLPKSPEPTVERNELLLKLFFGKNVPPAVCIEHVELWRLQVEDVLQYLQEVEEHIKTEHGRCEEQPYWMMTIKYGRMHAQVELEWCDYALKVLQKIKTKKREK